MQNAQIWKSIEALCDEAEAVIKDGTSMMAVVKSAAPPAMAREQKANQTGNAQTEESALMVLPSQAPPPAVIDTATNNPVIITPNNIAPTAASAATCPPIARIIK